MRVVAVSLAVSLLAILAAAPGAVSQTASEPTPEQLADFEACLDTVDGAAIDAVADEMLERYSEITGQIDAACRAGRRDEAAALYAPLRQEYEAHPEVRKLRACVAALDAARGIVEDEPHVCDEE